MVTAELKNGAVHFSGEIEWSRGGMWTHHYPGGAACVGGMPPKTWKLTAVAERVTCRRCKQRLGWAGR